MTLRPALLALALVLPLGSACATSPPQKALTMQDVLDASTPADWRTLDPENTLYLELDSGRVVIELAPAFAPQHVANIRTLARAGYFDGLSINRSQDNFVVQWGDPDADDASKARKFKQAAETLPAEFTAVRIGREVSAGSAAMVPGVDHGPQAPSIAISRMAVTCGLPVNRRNMASARDS